MAWYDSVGKMAKSFIDFTGVPGLIHDVSNMASNSDPWYSDALNLVKDVGKVATTPLRGAVTGALALGQKSYEAGGVARQWLEKGILDTPLMYNKFKNEDETFDEYKQRVAANSDKISLGEAALSVFSPGKNAGDRSGWLSDWTDHNLKFMSAGFDLFNPQDRQTAFHNQWTGKILTGIPDLAASTVIDPMTFTGFLGKGAAIASRGIMLDNINGKLSRAVFGKFAMDNEKVASLLDQAVKGEGKAVGDVNFLANTDAKGQYKYWEDKKVTNPDAMAYLFGAAKSPQEVAATFRAVMFKDAQAMSEVASARPETALLFDNLSEVPHPHREFLNNNLAGDILTSDEYHKAMGNYIAEMSADQRFAEALKQASAGVQLKYGFESNFIPKRFTAVGKVEKAGAMFAEPEVQVFQKTSLHPSVKVINYFTQEVPSGIFDVNAGNSYREFNTFLREVNSLSNGTFAPKAAELADRYLATASQGERLNIITEAEKSAMAHVFPQYNQSTLDKIYAIYDSRRARAITEHKNRGYLSYFDGDQIQHAVLPVLRSESANKVVIADIRKLKRAIDAHAEVLPSVLEGVNVGDLNLRTQRGLQALDTVNDIFKTSVLMRLGYTVRNQAEAQLSMVAKGFALPAIVAASGKEGVKRFFDNRKVGFQRLADHVNVMLGRKEDLTAMQHEFASQMDQVRSIDMSQQQLYKAAASSIPSDLTGVSDYDLRRLGSALATLKSNVHYHGTPENKFQFDLTKPISTSMDRNIAKRYMGQGDVYSVEQYLKTPSGRPGKLADIPHPEGKNRLQVATERFDTAKKDLAEAEKQIKAQGRSMADVTGLQRNLYEAQSELRSAKASASAATKRAATINDATEHLRGSMIDAVNAGKDVEVMVSPGKWRKVKQLTWDDLLVAAEDGTVETKKFSPEAMQRAVFRIDAKQGKLAQLRTYGKDLDFTNWDMIPAELRESMFGGKKSNFKAWTKEKGWQDTNSPIYKYLKDNSYASASVADDALAAGKSHVVLPEAVGNKGRKREVKRIIKEIQANAPKPEAEVIGERTAAQNRQARRSADSKERLRQRALAVSPYYDTDSFNAMLNNGIEDAAITLANNRAAAEAHLSDMAERMGARISRAEELAVKKRAGYGYKEFNLNGHTYKLPNAFQEASWHLGNTSAESTWNALVASQEMAFTAGIGAKSVRLIQPNDPRYFEGWANILSQHFRNVEKGNLDPVVERILAGQSNQDILNWFKTSEGALYANDTYTQPGKAFGFGKIKAGELDDKLEERVSVTRGAVKAYLPDDELANMITARTADGKPLTAGELQKHLIETYGSQPEKLVPLNGLLVTTSKEFKDQERIVDMINRRVMRFLGSLPEDVFARHPLAIAVYNKRLRLNLAQLSKAKGTDALTAEELDGAVANAREESRREVERTLFTIVRRTGASSSQVIRLMFPFYAAYENTIQRWSGMIAENPMIAANAMRTIAQVVNAQQVVDQQGNRVTDAAKIGNANLVVQVPQGFINTLPKSWRGIVQNSFKNVQIPLSSLDVITQGQPGNPGFGPFMVLPTYLVLSQRPELENALSPFFPAGIPQSAADIFTPSAARRMLTVWRKDDLYVRTYNQMMRYEMYNYNAGKREMPTIQEITDKTNKFFFLRALTSITAPFAVMPELDFYQQAYRNLQSQYANYKDPQTGKSVPGMAESKFLEMYPDFFEATISLSKNPGSLEPSIGTVQNLRKFSNLMGLASQMGDPEIMGFLADDGDNKYTFSQAAYKWQYSHGAYPGAGSTYRQNRTSAELLKDANVKRGWSQYQDLMGQLNAYKIQNGLTDKDPLTPELKMVKQLWLQEMAKKNIDWYSQYASPDKAKYERRARIFETALADKKWMAQNGNRPVVKNMALYLDVRKQIGNILEARYQSGGSRSLTANSNADVAGAFDDFQTQLISGSPETEQFINRYFANDSVVL